MENTLTPIVYLASPAARNVFGSVKLNGQMQDAQMANVVKSCFAIAVASADRENSDTIGWTNKTIITLANQIPRYASRSNFLLYRFACSFSPAPMQRPITVTIGSPWPFPGSWQNPATLLATAFAAIAAVPNVAVQTGYPTAFRPGTFRFPHRLAHRFLKFWQ